MKGGYPIVTGAGKSQQSTAIFPETQARYIRLINVGGAQNWWSLYDVRVFSPAGPVGSDPGTGDMSRVQRKAATLSDGTQVTALYNSGRASVSFTGNWGTTQYIYTLPAAAVGIFTERGVDLTGHCAPAVSQIQRLVVRYSRPITRATRGRQFIDNVRGAPVFASASFGYDFCSPGWSLIGSGCPGNGSTPYTYRRRLTNGLVTRSLGRLAGPGRGVCPENCDLCFLRHQGLEP